VTVLAMHQLHGSRWK